MFYLNRYGISLAAVLILGPEPINCTVRIRPAEPLDPPTHTPIACVSEVGAATRPAVEQAT